MVYRKKRANSMSNEESLVGVSGAEKEPTWDRT